MQQSRLAVEKSRAEATKKDPGLANHPYLSD